MHRKSSIISGACGLDDQLVFTHDRVCGRPGIALHILDLLQSLLTYKGVIV